MIADRRVLAVIAPLSSRCSVADVCSYNRSCEKIVNWSIVQSCVEYEQWERKGTAEIAEFSAGLQTRQEERYVISLFLLPLGGSFTRFSHDICAGHSPLTVKNIYLVPGGMMQFWNGCKNIYPLVLSSPQSLRLNFLPLFMHYLALPSPSNEATSCKSDFQHRKWIFYEAWLWEL